MHNNRRVLINLALIPGVGPTTVFKLLRGIFHEQFPDLLHAGWTEIIEHAHELNFDVVYDYTAQDFTRLTGIIERASALVDGLKNEKLIDDELDLVYKNAIEIVTVLDKNYPELLKQIHMPPLVLYCKGAPLTTTAKRMGFVGSRKATTYAADVTQRLVSPLVEQGWEIVSGGAEGADTMAHRVTLENNGVTRAVLGSGLLNVYPLSNIKLFEAIAANNGTVISPFSLKTDPDRGNFPARNRIIAGLSLGCVVVQAAAKSGALITAHCALEQGRQVFAVPGLVFDELSAGCHSLIKQGAKLVNTVSDILEEFGETSVSETAFQPAQRVVEGKKESGVASCHSGQGPGIHSGLTTSTDPLLMHLSAPATIDDLLEKTGWEMSVLQQRLFEFNLEGKVKQNFVGMWEIK